MKSLCLLLWGLLLKANTLEVHKISRHGIWQNFHYIKLVMLLLAFHKERIFSLKKISMAFFFLCSLEQRQQCLALCRVNTLNFQEKSLGEHQDKIPGFVQKLYKKAEREEPQVFRPNLHFTSKMFKSGFVTLPIGASDFKGIHNSSER